VRLVRIATLACVGLLLGVRALVPSLAHADVPRSCVHTSYDPIECPRETRLVHRDVLPSARLKALDEQRRRIERAIPLQEEERQILLEEIRDALRPGSPGR
jgi:hypothetical protein